MSASVYTRAGAQYWPQLSATLPFLLSGNWTEEALLAMESSGHLLRVLLDDNAVVAFAEVQWIVDECQLYNIAVLPHRQRMGQGLLLLNALLNEARTAGMKNCVLEVRESNLAARKLYEKAGFIRSGRRPAYYPSLTDSSQREAALIYSCLL